MNLINRIKDKFSKKQKPFRLKKIDPIKKAIAMDLILELCMNYYIHKENKIDFYKVEGELFDKLGIHSWESGFLLDIMADSGYINEDYKENDDIDRIYCTPKGIKIYLNGGFKPIVKRKIRERKLIMLGQYLSIVIGVYYTATFLKEYLGVTPELLNNLIYKIGNLLKK